MRIDSIGGPRTASRVGLWRRSSGGRTHGLWRMSDADRPERERPNPENAGAVPNVRARIITRDSIRGRHSGAFTHAQRPTHRQPWRATSPWRCSPPWRCCARAPRPTPAERWQRCGRRSAEGSRAAAWRSPRRVRRRQATTTHPPQQCGLAAGSAIAGGDQELEGRRVMAIACPSLRPLALSRRRPLAAEAATPSLAAGRMPQGCGRPSRGMR